MSKAFHEAPGVGGDDVLLQTVTHSPLTQTSHTVQPIVCSSERRVTFGFFQRGQYRPIRARQADDVAKRCAELLTMRKGNFEFFVFTFTSGVVIKD